MFALKRYQPQRQPLRAIPALFKAPAKISEQVRAVPKSEHIEHEGYRRLVAALPCKHCGVPGRSQCAHPNTDKAGGKKLIDDRLCFPLCTDAPGIAGCHTKFDQGALFTKAVRREREPAWAADTRRAIRAAGKWPNGLEWIE